MNRFIWFAFIVATAGVTLFVFHKWGITGSLILIGLWGIFVLGISIRQKRLRALIRKRLANMSEVERIAALNALSEGERVEVMDALKRKHK